MADVGVKFKITSDTQALNKSLRTNQDEFSKTTKVAEETEEQVEQVEDSGQGLDAISLAGVTAAFAYLGTVAKDVLVDVASVAIEFDTGMRKVMTLLDESAQSSVDWNSAFKTAAIETGQSLTDVTDATYQAISAGISYEDSIAFVTEQNKLAIGGQTDLASAIDVTTKTLNAYGLGAEEASRINDILVATQNNGITTVDELSQSLAQVTPTAAAMGVEFEQVGAAMATMTAQGTPTAQATTQLNSLLAELGKSGTVASERFQELSGQTFQEFIANGGTLSQAVMLMTTEMDGFQEQVAATADELPRLADGSLDYGTALDQVIGSNQDFEQSLIDQFGSLEAAKAAMQLANQEGELFTTNLDAMTNSAGATTTAFNTMTEGSPAFALSQANAAVDSLKASLGEQLAPAITPIADAFTSLTEKLQENETAMKLVVAVLITLAATFIILSIALGIMAIQAFIASIAVNSLLWPILLVVAAVIFIIVVVLLFKDQIVSAFNTVKDATIAAFGVMWDWVKEKFQAGKDAVVGAAKSIKEGVTTAFESMKSAIQSKVDWIVSKLQAFKNKVLSIKDSIVNGFKNMVSGIATGISGGVDTLIAKVKSMVNNYMISPLNSAIGIINKIPKVNIPTIPALAKGGIVGLGNNGTIAQVGEAGPEAVIPLKDSVLSKIGQSITQSTPGMENSTAGKVIQVIFQGDVYGVEDFESKVTNTVNDNLGFTI